MAKDYFQDIIPPSQDDGTEEVRIHRVHESSPMESEEPEVSAPERSIRNIQGPARSRPLSIPIPPERNGSRKIRRWVLWLVAIVCVAVVALLAVLFFFRQTTVTVTPKSHQIVFDQTSQFTAFPAGNAASGTLTYTVQTLQLTASQTLPAQGMQETQTKASGTITVANDYSASPQTLIKNTRFETPSGLIFRTPSQIVIPGKTAAGPGTVTVTVVADQPGAQYNIGPVSRFTLPGLQSTPAMYNNIYATSNASTSGGFSGQEPVADPASVASAVSSLRNQLASQAQQQIAATASSTTEFAGLMQISYQDQPNTQAGSSSVSINEAANVQVPIFPSALFAQTVAQTVAADADTGSFTLIPGPGYNASFVSSTSTSLGSNPINFALTGQATLIWNVDTQALQQALAGRDQGAFQVIVGTFPSIQEAHARIEPFWNTSFPGNPSQIKIIVEQPATSS